MTDCVPTEIIVYICQHFLSTRDQLKLRSCSRVFNDIVLNWVPNNPVNFELQKGQIVRSIVYDRRNTFITGSAGVGKTTTLHTLWTAAQQQRMRIVMLAPTQMAAEHVPHGRTIHSFLRLRKTLSGKHLAEHLEKWDRCNRRYPIARQDIIVVDECSMCGHSLMSCMDRLLRHAYGSAQPFGGVQMVFCGDFCQLPPVCDRFGFLHPLWQQLNLRRFDLTIPLRQTTDLAWFFQLEAIRQGRIKVLAQSAVIRRACPSLDQLLAAKKRPVVLCSDNKVVEAINYAELDKNPNPVERILHAYDTFHRLEKVNGVYHRVVTACPQGVNLATFWRAPQQLPLKISGRYICTMNLDKPRGVINGRSCTYVGDDTLKLDNGVTVDLMELQTEFTYALKNGVYLCRRQVALRLGYAMTIHRSQGMTIDKAVCDLRTLRCAGQAYVAFSRVKKMSDLYLVNVDPQCKIPVSDHVLRFYGFTE